MNIIIFNKGLNLKKLVLIMMFALLTSCAGIIKGTKQSVTFNSTPSGAEVSIDGISMGSTPLTVKLKKNKYENITIKKQGYRSITRPLEKEYDATALLNIFWDLSTTDLITGAAYEYEPNMYNFNLEKEVAEKK